MSRDTFDMFQDPERGRFGDNEQRSERVTGAADLVDLKLILRQDRPNSIAVNEMDHPRAPWIFLPKSAIEYAHASAGYVEVTLPRSLAEEKGLA
jgi:hypothetical protein